MVTLLAIENSEIRLEFHCSSRAAGARALGTAEPFFEIVSPLSGVSGFWTDPTGGELELDSGGGPFLFEDTSYDIQVRSLMGRDVSVRSRSQRPLKGLRPVLGDRSCLAGSVNFRRSVGRFSIDILVDAQVSVSLTVEVFPTKVSYRDDYEEMLREVEGFRRQLALAYLRPTYRQGSTVKDSSSRGEFLSVLRAEIQTLSSGMRQIERQPNRQLAPDFRLVNARKIRRPTPGVVRQVSRGAGGGPMRATPSGLRVRDRLQSHGRSETLNTPEHRWLKSQLADLLVRVSKGRALVQDAVLHLEAQGYSPDRHLEEAAELRSLSQELNALSRIEPIAEASGAPPPGFSSETLQRQPGYREVSQSLFALRRGVSALGASHETSVQDLDVLYELWCFFKVASILSQLADQESPLLVVKVHAAGVDLRLSSGTASTIRIGSGDPRFEVSYNLSFREATGRHRPDVILRIQHSGWPPIIVVFDAKYRVRNDARTLRRNGMPAPPQDAVDALHRYRDALTLEHMGVSGRPVVKGVALYPATSSEAVDFDKSGLAAALDSVGIGAIPFLPGNVSHLEQFLRGIVQRSAHEMAGAGPPFLAEREARTHP